jgi:hypothetical protein
MIPESMMTPEQLEDKRQKRKRWVRNNIEHFRKQQAAYYRRYWKTHPYPSRPQKTEFSRKKRESNLQFRLAGNLRARLGSAVRQKQKAGSAIKDLGCSIEEFKTYIESRFQDGMTWDNYGKHGWHLDHITPLSSFDLTDRQQFLLASHYTNYHPMWAKFNIQKSGLSVLNFRGGFF